MESRKGQVTMAIFFQGVTPSGKIMINKEDYQTKIFLFDGQVEDVN